MIRRYWSTVIAILIIGIPAGCFEKSPEDLLPLQLKQTQAALDHLSGALAGGQVRNAMILQQYTDVLKGQRPELGTLMRNLASDATTRGAMYKNLVDRLATAQTNPQGFASPADRLKEVRAIGYAARPDQFDGALADVVNVVADMSGGSLARVDSVSKTDSLRRNSSKDMGAGSQLIGNPSYGSWRSGSGGRSFWEWYGMYSMFSHLVGGRSYGYGYWNRHRDWSYYNDVGRSRWGNYSQRGKFTPTSTKRGKWGGGKRKSYGNMSSKRRTSTYGRSAGGRAAPRRSGGFGSSFRSAFSRGGFGGK